MPGNYPCKCCSCQPWSCPAISATRNTRQGIDRLLAPRPTAPRERGKWRKNEKNHKMAMSHGHHQSGNIKSHVCSAASSQTYLVLKCEVGPSDCAKGDKTLVSLSPLVHPNARATESVSTFASGLLSVRKASTFARVLGYKGLSTLSNASG